MHLFTGLANVPTYLLAFYLFIAICLLFAYFF